VERREYVPERLGGGSRRGGAGGRAAAEIGKGGCGTGWGSVGFWVWKVWRKDSECSGGEGGDRLGMAHVTLRSLHQR
jgi:hypothetical protein